jgi:hypothetical protein
MTDNSDEALRAVDELERLAGFDYATKAYDVIAQHAKTFRAALTDYATLQSRLAAAEDYAERCTAENTRMEAENDVLRKEAARYRWLRDRCPEGMHMTLAMRRESDEWDAAIDAHLEAAP